MCIGNERKPTATERKTLKEAYKVFNSKQRDVLTPSGLYPLCSWNEYPYNINVWHKAQEIQQYPHDAGFYCLPKKEDAELVAKEFGIHLNKNVVKKVLIRKIIGIGKPDSMGNKINALPEDSILRCKEILILPE